MFRDLRQRWGLASTVIECSGKTRNGILYKAVTEHDGESLVHQNHPREKLVDALEAVVDDNPYVLVLDEADVIPDLDVLEDLFAVDGVSVVAIAHQQVKWLNRVNRDLRPHFHGDSHTDSQIEFRKYGVDELVDILKPRVEHGLQGDPTQDGHLERIADETGGVARWAIKSVLSAAELALKRGHDYFHDEDVDDSFEHAIQKIRKANLRSLPLPHQRLYEIVRTIGPVSGTEMRAAYEEHQAAIFKRRGYEPVGWRRAWDYLSKMDDYGLIKMPGDTNATVYKVVDEELEAPVEFDPREAVELD